MAESRIYAAEIKIEPGDEPDIGIWVVTDDGRMPIILFEETHEVVELGGLCANSHDKGLAIGWLRAVTRDEEPDRSVKRSNLRLGV